MQVFIKNPENNTNINLNIYFNWILGLKDQVMALKWVKQNCKHFGGDPNNISKILILYTLIINANIQIIS